MNIDGISPCRDQRRIGGTSNQCQIMAAHYGDIPTGGTEIDVLPTNAAAYRVRLVVLRTRADNEILARIRTCAGSDGYIAKNNIVGVVIVQFVNGDLSRAIFIGLRFRSGGVGSGSTGGTGSGPGSTGGTGSGTGSTYPVPMNVISFAEVEPAPHPLLRCSLPMNQPLPERT